MDALQRVDLGFIVIRNVTKHLRAYFGSASHSCCVAFDERVDGHQLAIASAKKIVAVVAAVSARKARIADGTLKSWMHRHSAQ